MFFLMHYLEAKCLISYATESLETVDNPYECTYNTLFYEAKCQLGIHTNTCRKRPCSWE